MTTATSIIAAGSWIADNRSLRRVVQGAAGNAVVADKIEIALELEFVLDAAE